MLSRPILKDPRWPRWITDKHVKGYVCVSFSQSLPLSLYVRSIGSVNKINKLACVWTCREKCMSVWRGGDRGGECICERRWERVAPKAGRPFSSHQLLRRQDTLRAPREGQRSGDQNSNGLAAALVSLTHTHTHMHKTTCRLNILWTLETTL